MRLIVSWEDRPDVDDKAVSVHDRQEVEERGLVGIVQPGISSVRNGRVVQDKDREDVMTDGGEVLGVRPKVEGAVLAIVASPHHSLTKPIIHSRDYSLDFFAE